MLPEPRHRASSIDLIPLEVLSIVFGFVLGGGPFGREERNVYICLRNVCSSWRRAAATRGLCAGLDVPLHEWVAGLRSWADFKAESRIAPWLSIIRPTGPYHLLLRSEGCWSADIREKLIRYLLNTTPTPTGLSISNHNVLRTILATARSHNTITFLEVAAVKAIDPCPGLPSLQRAFPKLRTFIIVGPYNLHTTVRHGTLQRLVIHHLATGTPDVFLRLISFLPSLRELEIGTADALLPEIADVPSDMVLPPIEVLAILGETLAVELLSHSTLPSLKFLILRACGVDPGRDSDLQTFFDFFSRSNIRNCAISLIGTRHIARASFLASFMKHLPPETLFHVRFKFGFYQYPDIFDPGSAKEIVCPGLEWLDSWSGVAPRQNPVKMFVPLASDAEWEEAGFWRKELGELGYILENCSTHAMEERFRSRVPWMSIDWEI